jgi:hypothetical protein
MRLLMALICLSSASVAWAQVNESPAAAMRAAAIEQADTIPSVAQSAIDQTARTRARARAAVISEARGAAVAATQGGVGAVPQSAATNGPTHAANGQETAQDAQQRSVASTKRAQGVQAAHPVPPPHPSRQPLLNAGPEPTRTPR